MNNYRIVEYMLEDNQAALELEDLCPQGNEMSLKYMRPYFHARSEVYDRYKILCAKSEDVLVGITAAAAKQVRLHGKPITALYGYDLRVHPDYRKYGTARTLSKTVIERMDADAAACYTFIAAQNERALALAKLGFGARAIIPLTYLIIPVYKMRRAEEFQTVSGLEQNREYLTRNPDVEFVPEYSPDKMTGHVTSIRLNNRSGCSIWTNENLLAEQVVHLPRKLRMLKAVGKLLRPFISLPSIPDAGEVIKSWFLYDVYAEDDISLTALLNTVNNMALEKGRTFLYWLLQADDPVIKSLRKIGMNYYTLPYYFLAAGKEFPTKGDRLYVDIRDL